MRTTTKCLDVVIQKLDLQSHIFPERSFPTDTHGDPDVDSGCKQEGDSLGDGAETIFTLLASLFDSSLQGAVSIPSNTVLMCLCYIFVWSVHIKFFEA